MLLPSSILLDTNLNLKYVKTRNNIYMLVNAAASLACVAAVVMPRVATFGRTRNGFKRLYNPPTHQYSNLPTALHCTASLYHSPNGTLLGRSPKKACLYQNQRGSSLQCIGMFLWRLSLYLPLLDHK